MRVVSALQTDRGKFITTKAPRHKGNSKTWYLRVLVVKYFRVFPLFIQFLRGKCVTYWGRTSDQHTEWFPGVRAGLAIGADGELMTPHPACGQPNLGMALPGLDQLLTRPSCCCITEGK